MQKQRNQEAENGYASAKQWTRKDVEQTEIIGKQNSIKKENGENRRNRCRRLPVEWPNYTRQKYPIEDGKGYVIYEIHRK